MKIEKLDLQEPEFDDDKILQIIELEMRAKQEYSKKYDEYWQGRKDGIRLCLAILQPDERIWKQLIETSYGFRDEEYVVVKEFMKDARYNIAALLYELQEEKKVDSQTVINLIQWLDRYDRMVTKGITDEVKDSLSTTWQLHKITRNRK